MSRPFWRTDSCTVTVGHTADGGIEFRGYDRSAFGTPGHEYEYVVSVPTGGLSDLRRALGVDAGADLLAAVVGHVDEVMPGGEVAWLVAHGVEHAVDVWDGPPD